MMGDQDRQFLMTSFGSLDVVMPEVIDNLLICNSKFLSVLQFELNVRHFSNEGAPLNTS